MAEQFPLTFAQLLKQLRMDAGMTQEELATAAWLSPRSVSDLERGLTLTARKETARLLADALGLAGAERSEFERAAQGKGTANRSLAWRAAVRAAVALPADASVPARRRTSRRVRMLILTSLRSDAPGLPAADVLACLGAAAVAADEDQAIWPLIRQTAAAALDAAPTAGQRESLRRIIRQAGAAIPAQGATGARNDSTRDV